VQQRVKIYQYYKCFSYECDMHLMMLLAVLKYALCMVFKIVVMCKVLNIQEFSKYYMGLYCKS